MSAPQSFDVTSKMLRIDADLLRQAEAKFDAMFKASRSFAFSCGVMLLRVC